jgi:hypothetical protein
VTEPVDPIAIALTITRALDALGIIHTIGGSIASSIAGEPRSTLHIDVVAALHESHLAPLVDALSSEFYVDDEALRRAIRQRSSANVIHQATQLKVDIFVAGGTPLDEQQLRRRQAVEVADGQILHVHPPEDILLQKLRCYRKGGARSERQWRDILGIIRVQARGLDRDYLQANAPALDLADLLDRALKEATGHWWHKISSATAIGLKVVAFTRINAGHGRMPTHHGQGTRGRIHESCDCWFVVRFDAGDRDSRRAAISL